MNPIQFEEQTQSLYRLRSSRNKLRRLIDDRDRRLRALDREHTDVFYAFHRRPWVDLEEPYQRGWYRHFELTEATANHRQAEMYSAILRWINTVQQSYRKDFTKVKRQQGRKLRFETEHHLTGLTSFTWKKTGFGHVEAALFDWNPGYDRQGRFRYKLVFTQPWRYELKVRPRMITQVQHVNPELQSRLQEIDNRFEHHHLRPRRNKIVHGHSRWNDWRGYSTPEQLAARRFRCTPLHQQIADAHDEIIENL